MTRKMPKKSKKMLERNHRKKLRRAKKASVHLGMTRDDLKLHKLSVWQKVEQAKVRAAKRRERWSHERKNKKED